MSSIAGRGTVPRLREQLYKEALSLFIPPAELLRYKIRIEKTYNTPRTLKKLIALERLARQ